MKLTPSPRLFLLLILGIPFSLQAEDHETTDQITRSPIQTKAYYNDTAIWKDVGKNKIEIPVCWENIDNTNVAGKDWNAATQLALKNSWEVESSMEFTGWEQCPNSNFEGVRITVEDAAHPDITALKSPYVNALGNSIKSKRRGLVLNFTLDKNPGLVKACKEKGQSVEDCIKHATVHEFGHVLGLSHEHKSPSQNISQVCLIDFFDNDSYNPTTDGLFHGETLLGNATFTGYDPDSIMNYCNANRFKMEKPSALDELGLRAYYGRMPTYNGASGKIEIPRVDVSYNDEHGATIQSTNKVTLEKVDNRTGSYVVTSAPATQLESKAEAKFSNSHLHLPEVALIQGSHITQIWTANLTMHADGSLSISCGSTKRTHPTDSGWLC